jgi:ATP-binding cassette subfamily B protein
VALKIRPDLPAGSSPARPAPPSKAAPNGAAPNGVATRSVAALTDVPPEIAAALAPRGVAPADVRVCTDTDLDRQGNDALEWLVLTDDRLFTLAQAERGATAFVVTDLLYAGLKGARGDARVGSGMLEVEIALPPAPDAAPDAKPGSIWQELLRYSNAHADKFGRLGRKLHQRLSQQRPLVVTADDVRDERWCVKCSRPVLRSSGAIIRGADGKTYRICPRCVSKGQVVLRLLGLMRPYWPFALVALGLLGTTIALDLVPPRLTKVLIDTVFGGLPPAPWFDFLAGATAVTQPLQMLVLLVVLLACVQLSKVLITVANGALATHIGTRVTFDIRLRLFRRLQEQSVAYYDQQSVGILMTRVAQDTEELHGFISHITSGFLVQIVLLVAVGLTLFTMNATLALYTLLPAPLVMATTFAYWRFVLPRYYHFADQRGRLANVLYATLSGVRVVKAFGQEWREIGRFTGAAERLRRARIAVDRSQTTYYPLVSFVFSLGGLIVWYAGGSDVLGQRGMTLGTLMAFFGYLGLFYAPMNQLTQIGQWLTSFMTAAYRLFDVLDAEPQIEEAAEPKALPALRGEIEFDRMTFGYDPHYPVLHDISLRIEPGEMIGIVGPSGSGKSTLVNLLNRFYDPVEGAIRVDGVDLREAKREDLRKQVGLVLQEPFLFRGTIKENLAYGRPDASMEEIVQAATAANAHQFIIRQYDGYDTRLGEGGSGLSGGERQRLSIARALLCDPRILILDEATSSVDTESEQAIQDALSELTKGRTTIAIAHRLSTLRNADRIVVLEHGRVKETGTHQELMALGGLYHRLVSIQLRLSKNISLPNVDAQQQAALEDAADKKEAEEQKTASTYKKARFLQPDEVTFEQLPNGELRAIVEPAEPGGTVETLDHVRLFQAMPLTEPDHYVSIRHGHPRQREVGIIAHLSDLAPEQRRLAQEALRRRYISQIVLRITKIKQEFGLLEWDVETDRGRRQFSLPQSGAYVIEYGNLAEGRIVFDVYGNRYLIPNIHHLDQKSLSTFRRYVYW